MIKRIFTPFPALKTKQLNLRSLQQEDKEKVFEIRSSKDVAKYLERSLCKTAEEALGFINKIKEGIDNNEWIYWGISFKQNPALIGTICLWQISEEESKAEIGFELLPKNQGKGLMQEAVPAVLEYGFNEMNLQSIEGEVTPANIKSIKLMEKFGFTKIPDIRETDSDAAKEQKTIMYELRNNN